MKYKPWITTHKRLYISPAVRDQYQKEVSAIEEAMSANCAKVRCIKEIDKDKAMARARNQIANKARVTDANKCVWLCRSNERECFSGLRHVMDMHMFIIEVTTILAIAGSCASDLPSCF